MKDSEKIFQELKKDLKTYAELKFELLKLNTYERTGKVLSVLSYGIIVLFLAFFTILFIFLALGFWLGDYFESIAAGFIGVVALYLILIGIVFMNREKIRTAILNEIIAALATYDEKKNGTDNNERPTDEKTDTTGDIAS
jgi:hypothetical protein